MTWIVDIELVGVDPADPPDRWVVTFDVVYPGETWCRSVVFVAGAAADPATDVAAAAAARDALVPLLEREGRPVAFEIRLTESGPLVLGRRYPASFL